MNILRRYIYIYTHTREELEWPIIAVTVDPRIYSAIGSRARFHAEKKKNEGGEEFGIPANVTEAVGCERDKWRTREGGREKESVKMRDIDELSEARKAERKSQPR